METVIETRTIDTQHLLLICAGRLACTLSQIALKNIEIKAENTLSARIRRQFSQHHFRAYARLDLPTYARTDVQSALEASTDDYFGRTVVWQTLELATDIVSAATQLVASSAVLFQVLKDQPDGAVLAMLTLFGETYYWLSQFRAFRTARGACVPECSRSAGALVADMSH